MRVVMYLGTLASMMLLSCSDAFLPPGPAEVSPPDSVIDARPSGPDAPSGPGVGPPSNPIVIPPRDANAPLQTDRLEYVLDEDPSGYQTALLVRYTNRSSRTVYLPGCMPDQPVRPMYGFVRAAPDTGRVFLSLAWACVGGVPALAIPPSATRTDTILFTSSHSPNARPPIQPHERVGLMRVVYDVYDEVDENGEGNWRSRIPVEERRSNVFRIDFGPP